MKAFFESFFAIFSPSVDTDLQLKLVIRLDFVEIPFPLNFMPGQGSVTLKAYYYCQRLAFD